MLFFPHLSFPFLVSFLPSVEGSRAMAMSPAISLPVGISVSVKRESPCDATFDQYFAGWPKSTRFSRCSSFSFSSPQPFHSPLPSTTTTFSPPLLFHPHPIHPSLSSSSLPRPQLQACFHTFVCFAVVETSTLTNIVSSFLFSRFLTLLPSTPFFALSVSHSVSSIKKLELTLSLVLCLDVCFFSLIGQGP